MATLLAVLAAVTEFFKGLPIINSWFVKTPAQKEDEARQDVRKQMDEMHKTGRPNWED